MAEKLWVFTALLSYLNFVLNGTAHFKKHKQLFEYQHYSYLETSGCQSSNPYLNVAHFFQHQSWLEIRGSLRQLFSCIGV